MDFPLVYTMSIQRTESMSKPRVSGPGCRVYNIRHLPIDVHQQLLEVARANNITLEQSFILVCRVGLQRVADRTIETNE